MPRQRKRNRRSGQPPGGRPRQVVNSSTSIPTFTSVIRRPAVCTVPKHLQFVPDELDCWGRTGVTIQYTGGAKESTTWKVNSPYNLFGPQNNWVGAFSANVPAGSAELLQSTTATPAGATGFYSSSTIEDVELNMEIIATPGGNAPAAFVIVVPSLTADLSAVPTVNLREQRGALIATIPGQLNTNASPVQQPTAIKFSISMSDLFGVPRSLVRNSPDYAQIPLANPIVTGYLHIIVTAIDGVTAVNFTANHLFNLHHRFRRPNVMNSLTPV
jgi:hypothetical protein